MTNLEIASIFRRVAASYKIKNEKKYLFQIMAYERAADAIEHASSDIKDLWDEGKLDEIPGVGKSLKKYLNELFKTGRVKHFEELTKKIPENVFTLLNLSTVGPKRAYKLVKSLNLEKSGDIMRDLRQAVKENKVAKVPGFGKKSQEQILESLEAYERQKLCNRVNLFVADEIAGKVIRYMRKSSIIEKIDFLGSLRRRVATIGDIDIAVSSEKPKEAVRHFTNFSRTKRIIESGEVKATIITKNGYQLDLMVQPKESYGSLLVHFTGSKHHNIALREYAQKNKMSISEYGIKKGGKLYKFKDEKSFYKFLQMEWIPPELRENKGEIELALRYKLPKLIEEKDIKGDLHIHDNFDTETAYDLGLSSYETLINEAVRHNYSYIGFSAHSPSVRGHSDREMYTILKRRKKIIDKIKSSNFHSGNIRIFNLLEVDILANGSLSIPSKCLELLDGAICSIHSGFNQGRKKMTERVLNGLNHSKVKILGHPTGRIIGEREGYELDWDKIFDFCKKKNKVLEINSLPQRLDLPDFLVKEAVKRGVKMVINTDSHRVEQMRLMTYGVSVARRGWATCNNIINTLEYNKFSRWLKS